MRLVARVAGKASGVISSRDLRESFRFRTVGFVTTSTHDGSVELCRRNGYRIVSVLRLGTVAGFARDDDMPALLLLVDDVGMAALANIVAGKGHGTGSDLSDGGATVVSILPEAARNDSRPQDDEGNQRNRHDSGEPDEVFDVLQQVESPSPDSGSHLLTS